MLFFLFLSLQYNLINSYSFIINVRINTQRERIELYLTGYIRIICKIMSGWMCYIQCDITVNFIKIRVSQSSVFEQFLGALHTDKSNLCSVATAEHKAESPFDHAGFTIIEHITFSIDNL